MKRSSKARILKLEENFGNVRPAAVIRVVVSRAGKPLDWLSSRCVRSLNRSGLLTEIVRLDGSSRGITETELDNFVSRFRVEEVR